MTGPEKSFAEALSMTSNDPVPAASATMPKTSVPLCEKGSVKSDSALTDLLLWENPPSLETNELELLIEAKLELEKSKDEPDPESA